VRAAEVLFESLGVPSLHVASPGVLTLYASGETTGLVVDSGEGVTSVTPVYEGLLLGGRAVQRTELAGRDVTDALRLHLRRASFLPSASSSGSGSGGGSAAAVSYAGALGASMHTSAEGEVVRELKEAACYVAKDGDAFAAVSSSSRAGRSGVARHGAAASSSSSSSEVPTEFTLPDGQRVLLTAAERAGAAEVLFNPACVGLHEQPGVHQAVALALQACDVSLREALLGRLHLAGGTTLMRGYGDRLLRELAALTPPGTRLRLAAPSGRDTAAWVGGSIVASLSTFRSSGVSRAEWEERGEAAVLSAAVGSAGAV
jgi:centractin